MNGFLIINGYSFRLTTLSTFSVSDNFAYILANATSKRELALLSAKVHFYFDTSIVLCDKKFNYLEKCSAMFNSNQGSFLKDLQPMVA